MDVVECKSARKDVARVRQAKHLRTSYDHWMRRVSRAAMTIDLVLWVRTENLLEQLWLFRRGNGMRILGEIRDNSVIYVVRVYDDHDEYERDRGRGMFDAGSSQASEFRNAADDAHKAHEAHRERSVNETRRVFADWERPVVAGTVERLWRTPRVEETQGFLQDIRRADRRLTEDQLAAGIEAFRRHRDTDDTELEGHADEETIVLTGYSPSGRASAEGDEDLRRAYPLDGLVGPGRSALRVINTTRASPDDDPCVPFSAEQRQVLLRLEGERTLPLLIDGPAGSGKSTLLGAALAAAAQSDGPLPLFVTHSEELRRATRTRLSGMLQVHFGFDQSTAEQRASETCSTTGSYLLDVVRRGGLPPPPHDFADAERCRFDQFRRQFETICDARQISVELAWFVIRGFVKGYGSPDEADSDDVRIVPLSPDEFAEIPDRARQGVTHDQFTRAWHVAAKYEERLQKDGRWDDQDLAHAALRAIAHSPDQEERCAIVCDEAQDLTRADLRVLFRCFTGARELATSTSGHVSLPFVFAADPQQTVNPSGFSWKGFGELLFQETALLFGERSAVRREPIALRSNFRAARELVALSDHVNIERWQCSSRADRGSVPSTTRPERRDRGRIARYLWDEETDVADLSSSVRLIRPSGWRPTARQADLGPSTAADVKGLEFAEAIVIGFGDRLHQLASKTDAADGEAHDYLLNELYVAVTRARDGIHFVDSQEGAAALWEEFLGDVTAIDLIDRPLDELGDAIEQGNEAVQEAGDWVRRALADRNPSHARTAARSLHRVGERDRASAAIAVAHLLEATMTPVHWRALARADWFDDVERFLWERQDREGFRSLSRYASLGRTGEGLLGQMDVTLTDADPRVSIEHIAELLDHGIPTLPIDANSTRVVTDLVTKVTQVAEAPGRTGDQGFWEIVAAMLAELYDATGMPIAAIGEVWATAATRGAGLAAARDLAAALDARGHLIEPLEDIEVRLFRIGTGLTWVEPLAARQILHSLQGGSGSELDVDRTILVQALATPGHLDAALSSTSTLWEENKELATAVAAAVIEHSASNAVDESRSLTTAAIDLIEELDAWMS